MVPATDVESFAGDQARRVMCEERGRDPDTMYWKDWFGTVRDGHIRYPESPKAARSAAG